MAKNLRKKIYTRSTFRNKFIKKNLLKKTKNSIENRETNTLPLGENV